MKKLQYTTNDPASSTDYLAGDNTWKPMSGGGGGVPTTRNITINGTTQDLSADRTWNVGDMLTSTYDTDVDGVVDSAERIQIVVRNSTGSTLTKGQIVYLSGATGNRPNAVLAKADAEATSSKTIGMVIANIANNTDGQIAVNGTLHDLDTSAFSAGDMLWLSATTAGGMVANTPPAEPNHSVFIGYVARVHPTLGRVVLAIQNGYELDELHGVQITSVANNDGLFYNSTNGLWENKQLKTFNGNSIVGSGTELVFNYDRARFGYEAFTDFITPITANNGVDGNAYTAFFSGTSAAIAATSVPSVRALNQQGFIQPSTGSQLTGHAGVYATTTGSVFTAIGGGVISFGTSIYIPTLSTLLERYRIVLGFGTSVLNQSDPSGIFFTYDEGGTQNGTSASPNWQCVTALSNVRTLTTTSVAANTTAWQKFTIEINAAGTSVQFFIDNTLVATHTTNIPTGISQLITPKIQIAKSIGVTARSFYADYFGYKQTYTTPRI